MNAHDWVGNTAALANTGRARWTKCSVQAVDTAFAGSRFAAGSHFYLGPPRITRIGVLDGGRIAMECGGIPGVSYSLLASTNLHHWETRTNLVIAPNGLREWICRKVRRFKIAP